MKKTKMYFKFKSCWGKKMYNVLFPRIRMALKFFFLSRLGPRHCRRHRPEHRHRPNPYRDVRDRRDQDPPAAEAGRIRRATLQGKANLGQVRFSNYRLGQEAFQVWKTTLSGRDYLGQRSKLQHESELLKSLSIFKLFTVII